MSQLSLFKKNPFYDSKPKRNIESKSLFYEQALLKDDLKNLQDIVNTNIEVKEAFPTTNPLLNKILVSKTNGTKIKIVGINGNIKRLWIDNKIDPSKNGKVDIIPKYQLNLSYFDIYNENESIPDFKPKVKSRIQSISPQTNLNDYEKKAERFKSLAVRLQKQIDSLQNPAIGQQNPTARRARIVRSMWERGESLEEIQKAFYRLADFYNSKNIPKSLKYIKSKKDLEEIKWRKKNSEEYNLLFGEQRLDPIKQKQKELKEMETNLLGTKIPDFFPTPKTVINQMLSNIPSKKYQEEEEGMHNFEFLEPSAGKGDIVDLLKDYVISDNIDVIEINYSLQSILAKKGYNLVSEDFLKFDSKKYDYIIMNPPFSNLQDIDHVLHAYKLLKPNGKVISIMSEAPFFRSDRKATHFREWLQTKKHKIEKLEQGSFTGKESFRQTGVNTRMVVIKK